MSIIKQIKSREIIDSRGNPTIEAEVILDSGIHAYGCAPSGASTGSREALELRDKDSKRYMGKGVLTAAHNITNIIQPALVNRSVFDQEIIDRTMIEIDGTEHKSQLGANAILAVSVACARAAALSQSVPLYSYFGTLFGNTNFIMPVPQMNILNGGAHADNNVDIQEFMILPIGAPNFKEALRYGIEVYHTLKSILKSKNLNTNVGDEGGFAPNLQSNVQAVEFILEAIHQAGFTPGKEIYLGLDVAASEFYKNNQYHLSSENKSFDSQGLVQYFQNWAKQYPIASIEDALDESDWAGWQFLTQQLGKQCQLVGDDLFVTNTKILKRGIETQTANSILIKLNQIGTLTETFEAIKMARDAGYTAVISHRSGETSDDTIADLAVATAVGQIKTGAPCRSDRVAKYNQLLRIEEATSAVYAGKSAFKKWL